MITINPKEYDVYEIKDNGSMDWLDIAFIEIFTQPLRVYTICIKHGILVDRSWNAKELHFAKKPWQECL